MKMTINGVSFNLYVQRGEDDRTAMTEFIDDIKNRVGVLLINDELSYGSCYGESELCFVINRELEEYEDERFYKSVYLNRGEELDKDLEDRLTKSEKCKYIEACFVESDTYFEIGYTTRKSLFIDDYFESVGDLYGWVK